jgi:serine/threonine-protein kinase RsbW
MHWFRTKYVLEHPPMNLNAAENAKRLLVHSPAEMSLVLEKLEDWMRVLGYPNRDLFAVKLAVHEAMVNAFRHGNRCDSAKSVRVTLLVTAAEVVVGVEDEGRGFDLESVPDPLQKEYRDRPSGRGLFLMRAYSTWMRFEPPGNRVTLCRRRSQGERGRGKADSQ